MLINSEREARCLGAEVLGGCITQRRPSRRAAPLSRSASPATSQAALKCAYAIQGWLFAASVPIGWVILVRREARDWDAGANEKETPDTQPASVQPTPRARRPVQRPLQ